MTDWTAARSWIAHLQVKHHAQHQCLSSGVNIGLETLQKIPLTKKMTCCRPPAHPPPLRQANSPWPATAQNECILTQITAFCDTISLFWVWGFWFWPTWAKKRPTLFGDVGRHGVVRGLANGGEVNGVGKTYSSNAVSLLTLCGLISDFTECSTRGLVGNDPLQGFILQDFRISRLISSRRLEKGKPP